ncbi:hypothetical protein Sjap_018743 [Stephania japonica]|uniref:Cytochrome P450 n=1 Tax=Stephania japonica TaxID=461633 RepID=A0AAP0I8L1_9MAGN
MGGSLSSSPAFLEKYCLNSSTAWPEFCLASFCFLSITWYLKHKNKVMTTWPLIGILPSVVTNTHRILDWTVEIANTFGATVFRRAGPSFLPMEFLFTCDPSNVEYIVRTNFANYPKGKDYNETFDVLGEGIFNVESEFWRKQRSTSRAIMASEKFRTSVFTATLRVVLHSLLPLLQSTSQSRGVIDLEEIMMRYTFDISTLFIFGRDPKCLSLGFPQNELQNALDKALESVFYRHVMPGPVWKLFKWLNIGKERQLEKSKKKIDQCMDNYISEKKLNLSTPKQAENINDMLETYINLQKQESWPEHLLPRNDKFLKDTMLNMLFAGRDTVGTVISWFFYLLLKNPRVESKILEELRHVYAKKQKEDHNKREPWLMFDAADLKDMTYLHAAFCEALRLYPSVPLNRKTAFKEDVLPDGTVVRPGVMILISIYAMGRMEWIWGKDCLEFKPDRWIGVAGTLCLELQLKLFSFSFGPRACLGKNVAFTLMKMAASAMLMNFHIEMVEGQRVEPKSTIVLRMKNGLKVRVKKRSDNIP